MIGSIFKNIKYKHIFYLLGLLFLSQQLFVLFAFSLDQSDTDQMLMLEGAKDMSLGRFYSPYFYGQKYNSMFEAFLAAPLVAMGMDIWNAVPLATWVLSLFPWLVILIYCKRNQFYQGGILVLLLFFLLDSQYAILTHMSRGFTQGIFFAFLGLALWFFGGKKPYHLFLLVLFCLLGALQVPNSVILFPVIVLLFWDKKWLTMQYLIAIAVAFFLSAFLYFLIEQFYSTRPEYIIHHKAPLSASYNQWELNVKSIHLLFIHIFRGKELSHFVFLIIALGITTLSKKYWQMLIFIAFLIFSISLNKIADITESVFFSGGRFYMAVPLALALFLPFAKQLKPKVLLGISFIAIGLALLQTTEINHDIKTKPWRGKEAPVLNFTKEEVVCACDSIQKISATSDALIIYDHYFVEAVSLGCPLLKKNFPISSRWNYERRAWLKKELNAMRPKRITIMDRFSNLDSVVVRFPNAKPIWIEGQAYLFENKDLMRVDSIMKKWKEVPRL